MITDRPQPPSIEDPPSGNSEQWTPGIEIPQVSAEDMDDAKWIELAEDAYTFSTSWIDSNYRMNWDDSLRMFNSEHPSDSPYHHELFRKRSKLFRPKTRAMVRKNEAAAAAAFFSNLDRTSIMPSDQDNTDQRIAADVIQELVQYRLTKSIPWFLVVEGGIQDGQVQGAVVAHCHWRYITKNQKAVEDRPVIDLLPIENIRFDPAADWTDPINTSPYVIHLIPMYVVDVKARMEMDTLKGCKWKSYDDSVLMSLPNPTDITRMSRLGRKQDPTQPKKSISDYDTVWIHRHIHRRGQQDWEFYTLASEYLLTTPQPLEKSVFHGERPYVLGRVQIETHKALPAPMPIISKGLQVETNEVTNSRLDNVKLVMNKRWFALRGKNVDIGSLTRNVPGGVTLLDNLEDVKEQSFNDVTQSSYMEQDRINADFDELMGNFSAASVQTLNRPNQPAHSMQLLQAPANLLTEYMLKTFSETFVLPVLRQLVLLEQHYETDINILNLCGKKSGVFEKYGINSMENVAIDQELNVTVNVGMGVTDPTLKLQKFGYALTMMGNIGRMPPPGMDLAAIYKEIFGLSGYQDGSRFFANNDPEQANQAINERKQMMMMIKQLQMALKNKQGTEQVKAQIGHEKNLTSLAVAGLKEKNENARLLARHIMDTAYPETVPESVNG